MPTEPEDSARRELLERALKFYDYWVDHSDGYALRDDALYWFAAAFGASEYQRGREDGARQMREMAAELLKGDVRYHSAYAAEVRAAIRALRLPGEEPK